MQDITQDSYAEFIDILNSNLVGLNQRSKNITDEHYKIIAAITLINQLIYAQKYSLSVGCCCVQEKFLRKSNKSLASRALCQTI